MPSERIKSDPNGSRSVSDLLALYDEMIVPHFQRGLVWEDSSVSLLLESLYYETPCGLIILWTPAEASQQGTPLGETPKYVIVDGQQRIRSLRNVFKEVVDESTRSTWEDDDGSTDTVNGESEEDGEGNGIWCLNLGRVSEFEKLFTGGKRFRLFRRAKDPRKVGENAHGDPFKDREALLPLRWFLDHTDEEIAASVENDGGSILRKAVRAVLGSDIVKKKLRNIVACPRFHVETLDAAYKLEDVIGIYNRINSAGKRVESEEKAFANLVRPYPEVNKRLEEFFKTVHGDDALGHRRRLYEGLTRDNLLRRQKENGFGFKLFMRTLTQVLAYHSSRTIGASTFSFESVNADTMDDARTCAQLPEIVHETIDILVYLARVLREKLHCDDFRMLPETSSLWPVIQLVIRFPGLMVSDGGITSSLALRLLLADKQKKDLLKLCAGVNESQNLNDALSLFEQDNDLTGAKMQKTISRGISNANSLMNRYTLMLYWLLRSKGAKDFSYEINCPEKADALREEYGGTEAILREEAEAEKQHIVPYKRLKKIFNLEGRARPGRHEVNNIGNLTYISHGLNNHRTGIGTDPLQLDREPPDNLEAHLLMDRQGDLLEAYKNACRNADPDSPAKDFKNKKARRYFDKFSRRRRALITEAFVLWEEAVRSAGKSIAPIDNRPAKRLINLKDEDEIRNLGYPLNVESVLVTLCNMEGMVKSRKQGPEVSCAFRRKVGKKKREQLVRVDLYRSPQEIEIKFGDVNLQEWFSVNMPNILFNKKFIKLDVNKAETEEVVTRIFEKLQKIGQRHA